MKHYPDLSQKNHQPVRQHHLTLLLSLLLAGAIGFPFIIEHVTPHPLHGQQILPAEPIVVASFPSSLRLIQKGGRNQQEAKT